MKRALAVMLAATLVGCPVGPNYHRPSVPTPHTFRGQPRAEATSFADMPWWDLIRDPALTDLLREALANSYDLRAAAARVDVARQNVHVATSTLFPAVSLQSGPQYQQVFNPFNFPGTMGNVRYASYQLQGTLSWEIDLWGKLRRQREATIASFFAAEENRRGVIVSLVATVAEGYFNLVSLDMQLEISRATVQSRRETLNLFRIQEQGGVGNGLATASQEASVETAEATIRDLERQVAQAENLLSIVLGRVPGPIRRTRDFLQRPPPPTQPIGLPASLLERRPDVRAAEAALIGANAQVGAALATMLPQFDLSGNGGWQSSALGQLFAPTSAIFGVGLLVNWLAPILNGAGNYYRFEAQRANYRALVADYERTVLSAYADVADALVAIRTLGEQRTVVEREVAAWRQTVELSRIQFVNGVASYLDIAQAEQRLFPAQLQLVEIIASQFTALSELYRALGGGWRTPGDRVRPRP